MAEYIEREALKRSIRHAQLNPVDKGLACLLADEIPAADVEPVKRGEWVDKWGGRYANQCYKCSVCGEYALGNDKTWFLTYYCPNCGAKMKG